MENSSCLLNKTVITRFSLRSSSLLAHGESSLSLSLFLLSIVPRVRFETTKHLTMTPVTLRWHAGFISECGAIRETQQVLPLRRTRSEKKKKNKQSRTLFLIPFYDRMRDRLQSASLPRRRGLD